MATFRSLNVLGHHGMRKHSMPTVVLGDDGTGTPITIETPVSDGGIMCVGTSDLSKAAHRNWKHAGAGNTDMGAVIQITFNIGGYSFTSSLSSMEFKFGVTDVTEDNPGEDFTMGDPHRDLDSFPHDPVVVGTSLQLNEAGHSIQNVYFTPTLEMEWHGYRWWDASEAGGDSVIGGFQMRLSGVISPEEGFGWGEAADLAGTTTVWLSNWKVYKVGDSSLEDWGLVDAALGGPGELLATTHLLAGETEANFTFGNDSPSDTIPLRGYNFPIYVGARVSEILIVSCEIRFPTILGALPGI